MLLAAAGTRECRPAGRVPHAALRIDLEPSGPLRSIYCITMLFAWLSRAAHYMYWYYHHCGGVVRV
jgi:hypothetical protein